MLYMCVRDKKTDRQTEEYRHRRDLGLMANETMQNHHF